MTKKEKIIVCGQACTRNPSTCGCKPLTYHTKNGLELLVCRQVWGQMLQLARK